MVDGAAAVRSQSMTLDAQVASTVALCTALTPRLQACSPELRQALLRRRVQVQTQQLRSGSVPEVLANRAEPLAVVAAQPECIQLFAISDDFDIQAAEDDFFPETSQEPRNFELQKQSEEECVQLEAAEDVFFPVVSQEPRNFEPQKQSEEEYVQLEAVEDDFFPVMSQEPRNFEPQNQPEDSPRTPRRVPNSSPLEFTPTKVRLGPEQKLIAAREEDLLEQLEKLIAAPEEDNLAMLLAMAEPRAQQERYGVPCASVQLSPKLRDASLDPEPASRDVPRSPFLDASFQRARAAARAREQYTHMHKQEGPIEQSISGHHDTRLQCQTGEAFHRAARDCEPGGPSATPAGRDGEKDKVVMQSVIRLSRGPFRRPVALPKTAPQQAAVQQDAEERPVQVVEQWDVKHDYKSFTTAHEKTAYSDQGMSISAAGINDVVVDGKCVNVGNDKAPQQVVEQQDAKERPAQVVEKQDDQHDNKFFTITHEKTAYSDQCVSISAAGINSEGVDGKCVNVGNDEAETFEFCCAGELTLPRMTCKKGAMSDEDDFFPETSQEPRNFEPQKQSEEEYVQPEASHALTATQGKMPAVCSRSRSACLSEARARLFEAPEAGKDLQLQAGWKALDAAAVFETGNPSLPDHMRESLRSMRAQVEDVILARFASDDDDDDDESQHQ